MTSLEAIMISDIIIEHSEIPLNCLTWQVNEKHLGKNKQTHKKNNLGSFKISYIFLKDLQSHFLYDGGWNIIEVLI